MKKIERNIEDRTILDEFAEQFCDIVNKHCKYIVCSGFVAIAHGRTRGTEDIDMIVEKLNKIINLTSKYLEGYKFGLASEKLYAFVWHDFADKYLESVKKRLETNDLVPLSVLRHVLFNTLKLLHPFIPFVTESIWQELKSQRKSPDIMLVASSWPSGK